MKNKIKENVYFNLGLTLFITFALLIIFYFLILKIELWYSIILKVIRILSPIWLGLLFAYLMNPFVKFIEGKILNKASFSKKVKRVIGITSTLIVMLALTLLFIKFVIPSFFGSVKTLIKSLPEYNEHIYSFAHENFDISKKEFNNFVSKATNYINDTQISTSKMINNIASFSINIFYSFVNIFIGLIVSIYLLYDKEEFISNTKKVLKVILKKKSYNEFMDTLRYADKIFGGFLIAKIIDSLIIGFLTFIILSIFSIPYTLIISLIVGFTNIIPYFGPIIGAIPCIIFLAIVNPTKSIIFTILVLLIQQFDGNILGPKLIGHKIGMKSFWVLFSILFFGGLFGVAGMIFGVPLFALLFSIAGAKIEKKLLDKEPVK